MAPDHLVLRFNVAGLALVEDLTQPDAVLSLLDEDVLGSMAVYCVLGVGYFDGVCRVACLSAAATKGESVSHWLEGGTALVSSAAVTQLYGLQSVHADWAPANWP